METTAERVQFVIRFAQMDLDTLRPGDWLNLRDDLLAFFLLGTAQRGDLRYLNKDARAGVRTGIPALGEKFANLRLDLRHATRVLDVEGIMTDDMIRIMQAETRRMLQFVLATRDVQTLDESQGPFPIAWVDVHVRIAHVNLDIFAPAAHGNMRLILGSPRDAFLFLVSDLLIHESIDRIQHCPECDAIFYRVGKQQYCSRPCSNRANMRAWRQREEVKSAEAEHAHERYAKKQKQKVGPGASIARRPYKYKRSTAHAKTPRQS